MLKIGLVRLFYLALFGVVIPYGAYRLSRRIGAPLLLLLAGATGFGYGPVKADNPWNGDGLFGNLLLMAGSALVLLAYIGLAVGAAVFVAKAAANPRI
jgi:hypothetical protein